MRTSRVAKMLLTPVPGTGGGGGIRAGDPRFMDCGVPAPVIQGGRDVVRVFCLGLGPARQVACNAGLLEPDGAWRPSFWQEGGQISLRPCGLFPTLPVGLRLNAAKSGISPASDPVAMSRGKVPWAYMQMSDRVLERRRLTK
jgi:hypothetical protein